jgi:hypothetical protein
LTGFELYGEYEWLPGLSAVRVRMRYVHGQDGSFASRLPQIPPLESTVGVRLEDARHVRPWGLEGGMRMVARQDRFALFRVVQRADRIRCRWKSHPRILHGLPARLLQPAAELNIIGGIENLFDRNYIEHLDLRLPARWLSCDPCVVARGHAVHRHRVDVVNDAAGLRQATSAVPAVGTGCQPVFFEAVTRPRRSRRYRPTWAVLLRSLRGGRRRGTRFQLLQPLLQLPPEVLVQTIAQRGERFQGFRALRGELTPVFWFE